MDISHIKPEKTNDIVGIKVGKEEAPHKTKEFINLRCPFCRQWYIESKDYLETHVEKGTVQRVIKLWDKTSDNLQSGNRMHQYVPLESEKALEVIEKIFETQEEWGDLSIDEVSEFAEIQLGLAPIEKEEMLEEIKIEAEKSGMHLVPAIVTGSHVFDEHITSEALQVIFEK